MAAPVVPWDFLCDHGSTRAAPLSDPPTVPQPSAKTFAQVLHNACDVPLSQFPAPCMKGDKLAVQIPEDEYQAGLEACKTHLHGRILLTKGQQPLKIQFGLRDRLSILWRPLGEWRLVSLGKGFYEFAFASVEDLRRVLAMGTGLQPSNGETEERTMLDTHHRPTT